MAGRVLLSAALILSALIPVVGNPDIDVLYITRTPRYQRNVSLEKSNANPSDYGNTQPTTNLVELAKQRWPRTGETVTFTAVVKNLGNTPTGQFTYKWYFDDLEVASGTLP